MQNAGEDSGTTVKSGGVYELGRVATSDPDSLYGYYGTARASGLTVEAGVRATVSGTEEGSHRVYVADTGKSPKAGTDLTLVTTGDVDARHERGSSMTGAGGYVGAG